MLLQCAKTLPTFCEIRAKKLLTRCVLENIGRPRTLGATSLMPKPDFEDGILTKTYSVNELFSTQAVLVNYKSIDKVIKAGVLGTTSRSRVSLEADSEDDRGLTA